MADVRSNAFLSMFVFLTSAMGFSVFFLTPLFGLIWMAVEGLWWGILWGFGFGFLGILGLGIAQILIAVFSIPAMKVHDAGHKRVAILLMFPAGILMSASFQAYFFLIVGIFLGKYLGQASGYALFLYSFGVATGGLGYMLSKETSTGGSANGTFPIVFSTFGFLVAAATQYFSLMEPLASFGLATLIGFVGTALVGISKLESRAEATG